MSRSYTSSPPSATIACSGTALLYPYTLTPTIGLYWQQGVLSCSLGKQTELIIMLIAVLLKLLNSTLGFESLILL
jgi:hypothetical protein